MHWKIVVIDEEVISAEHIRNQVADISPTAIVHIARTITEAKEILQSSHIDLLFVPIHIYGQQNESFSENDVSVFKGLLFIVPYSYDALEAMKAVGLDYLVRPVKKSMIGESFSLLNTKGNDVDTMSLPPESYLLNKMSLGHSQGFKLVTLIDIVHLEANNSYTVLTLSNGEKITTSKPISKFESKLNEKWFFRIHKSYIINVFHFKEYTSKKGDIAVMDNGDELAISRYRLGEFLRTIQALAWPLKL